MADRGKKSIRRSIRSDRLRSGSLYHTARKGRFHIRRAQYGIFQQCSPGTAASRRSHRSRSRYLGRYQLPGDFLFMWIYWSTDKISAQGGMNRQHYNYINAAGHSAVTISLGCIVSCICIIKYPALMFGKKDCTLSRHLIMKTARYSLGAGLHQTG